MIRGMFLTGSSGMPHIYCKGCVIHACAKNADRAILRVSFLAG
jgi:hypothetical protein